MRFNAPNYPISLPGILLLGFVLVALPPLVVLGDTYLSFNRLTLRSESAIVRATEITRDSRALADHLTALERLARQQLVLGDEAGLKAYDLRREAFLTTLSRIGKHAAALGIETDLASVRDGEASVREVLDAPGPARRKTPQIEHGFAQLDSKAASIVRDADTRIERDIATLQEEALASRQQMLHLLRILVPGILVLALTLTFLIRLPFRQLEKAMHRLGEGHFDETVRVGGPSDMVSLGRRLDWLRTRLQALDAQKTRLLHHVSHELKTPLTALQEGTALLQDKLIGPLTPGQQEVVGILASNCQRLRRLIENLLDYSGLRAGPAHMRRESLPAGEVLELVAADHKLAASARNIKLELSAERCLLLADRDKIRVIVDNLLSNAIKYAPADSTITLTCRVQRDKVLIEVADAGPGVPPDLARSLFEPFVQGPAPQGSAVKGSGLGLSIVRELVALHGGSVELLPNKPAGTLARVTLPANGPLS